MYDSIVKAGHKKANTQLKSSIEEILKEEQQQEWTLEQMQVPQQIEEENCGYRMLYNIKKICNQENIEIIEDEEMTLEGYTLEIIKILKGKQQDTVRREEEREGKRVRKEKEQEREIEKRKNKGGDGKPEEGQELERREQEMHEQIIEKREEMAKKEKRKRRRRGGNK